MEHLRAAAHFAGIVLDRTQLERLEHFGYWLGSEALRAGGIGPDEVDRLERRHLADSILFATYLNSARSVWDLGTGVGLPGIPLAIALPATEFLLVDRSGRRIDLLHRAIRILGLENCQVRQGEIEHLAGTTDAMVARASLPPPRLGEIARRHLSPRGRAVVAGSWQSRPEHVGWETVEIPEDVLDQTVWLLIMRQT